MFKNYMSQEDYEVLDIEGTIPTDLEGTFYRNGPGESKDGFLAGLCEAEYLTLSIAWAASSRFDKMGF